MIKDNLAEKRFFAVVENLLERGRRNMELSEEECEDSVFAFWDGFHHCAETILRVFEVERMTDEEYNAFITALTAKAGAISASSPEKLKESFLMDDQLLMRYELDQRQKQHSDFVPFDLDIDKDLYFRLALAARRQGAATTDLLAEAIIEIIQKRVNDG